MLVRLTEGQLTRSMLNVTAGDRVLVRFKTNGYGSLTGKVETVDSKTVVVVDDAGQRHTLQRDRYTFLEAPGEIHDTATTG